MKTIFEDIEYLKKELDDKKAKKILNELEENIHLLKTKSGLSQLMGKKRLAKITRNVEYENELKALQVELIKLQNWVYENNKRVMIIFEGRDAAGKGGSIKRFTQYLNPRKFRVVALQKPTEVETGQFYFQRYFQHLPNPGEITFFDRSWYNRAIVEPVFNFCTEEQYQKFMREVPEIEHALVDDGIILIKLWYSITKENQQKRFKERMTNPLKHWKLSPVDQKAQEMWDKVTFYKEEMFSRSHTSYAPWVIVNSNDKKTARLESIRYVLSQLDYEGKDEANINLHHDPDVVERYHRKSHSEG
ncbi:MAG: Probable UDP-galactose-lipid carrier transferase [uncultured Sulfurovum sp.]|uniref:ADP/GDP-polyphosphate phosphotransferase n=1 Tax=uncultured Sulfurovum sp. TaxID=269237 RepID=A0A6S6SF45_9BACT|nr:MAG: Probable UDP-galactose-lipid carrier transferase [uncultured Sulfurovum sp.]